MKIMIKLSLLVLSVLSVFLANCQTHPNTTNTNTTNVAGHAEMTVAPDQAKVYAEVSLS